MMRYARLFGLFLKASFLVELEYRANFAARAVVSLFWAGVTLTGAGVFYSHAETIGGWTFNEALVIIGLFTFMSGFIQTFLQPNVQRIIDMIRLGTLDFVLTKPVNSQFMASLRHAQVFSMVDMLLGAVIVIWACMRLGYAPPVLSLAQFALMLLMAVLIVYSIWMVIATLAFWLVKVNNMAELFTSVYDTGRFPVTTFDGLIRLVLTFVIPIAFITTFPAQSVLGRLDTETVLMAVAMGGGMFGFSSLFWRYAVRSYSSASS
ncbi:MAG: ABC-2 family transporter protein [Anaerolineae bacterium]|nr:ABC-2 family transporter protein [Thermoflexales bacterium]MDW8406326.1 ABC-2 family transporter protein [Anaerolineae bacterium]